MAQLTDDQITDALNGMIAGINPIIDVLAQTDVTGLRAKTFQDGPKDESIFRRVEHFVVRAVDLTDLPGTKGWSELSMDERANWWVNRIGSLNTIGVAFPNIFGLWARRLPLNTVLGFVNQAMVLIAMAREYRVTDRSRQIELLAEVLGGRKLVVHQLEEIPDAPPVEGKRKSLIRATWDIARTLQNGLDEMGKRPQPAKPLRWLSNIPVVGAPFNYVGERLALRRAVNGGRAWIVAHPDAITRAPRPKSPAPAPATPAPATPSAALVATPPDSKTVAPAKKAAKKAPAKKAPPK